MSQEEAWKYARLSREQFGALPGTMWHGTPDVVGGGKPSYGVHVGTRQAAREALNARIGKPDDGRDWDSTRVYGETRLGGYSSGYGADHLNGRLPSGRAEYSDGTKVPLTARPDIAPLRIVGPMTNTPQNPHRDWRANGYMRAQIKRGTARRGYFYTNEGEDAGSISAVVPSREHLRTHDDYVREAMPFHEPAVFNDRRG